MKSSRTQGSIRAELRRKFRRHLRDLGFVLSDNGELVPPQASKEFIRHLHSAQRASHLADEGTFVSREWPRLNHLFADGIDVDPKAVTPQLELVRSDTWQARLFRLASLTWSVPVSRGYGRRLRFLVWDASNGKLVGLIALGDPVFNLSARDRFIGWTVAQRTDRLVDLMDAYVLGALPPYNQLLCGKLVASLVRSKEIRDIFAERYSTSVGIISQKRKAAHLVMVTTTSALGRSSVYNRLKLGRGIQYVPVGFTQGWGHFHMPDRLFALVRQVLQENNHSYAQGFRFGDGPNWRLRAVRQALKLVGLNPSLLRHGIQREVFVCEIASNASKVLRGQATIPRYSDLDSIKAIGALARDRWIVPRAERRPTFRDFRRDSLLFQLRPEVKGT